MFFSHGLEAGGLILEEMARRDTLLTYRHQGWSDGGGGNNNPGSAIHTFKFWLPGGGEGAHTVGKPCAFFCPADQQPPQTGKNPFFNGYPRTVNCIFAL